MSVDTSMEKGSLVASLEALLFMYGDILDTKKALHFCSATLAFFLINSLYLLAY